LDYLDSHLLFFMISLLEEAVPLSAKFIKANQLNFF